MKKIMFIFTIFFIGIIGVNAEEKFTQGEKVPNMYIETKKGDLIHNGAPYLAYRSDGEVAYCLNPFIYMDVNGVYNEYNYNDESFNLSDETINKINLISHFGYKYENHTDLKWYGITQFMIWRELVDEIYFTDVYKGNKVDMYEKEIKEIEYLINNYNTNISFNNKKVEYSINRNFVIYDENEVIEDFEIVNNNLNCELKNNRIYIIKAPEGDYTIKLVKKSNDYKKFVLYNKENAQSLIYPGGIKDIEANIYANVRSGSITINKLDSEAINRQSATLEGAIYGLYSGNKLVSTITTNENGIGYIDGLMLQAYTLKELKPSIGYLLDNNIYSFDLRDKKDLVLELKEEVIKKNIIINKYYGKDNFLFEDGAVFLIDNNQYTTNNGIINLKLDYGTHSVKQLSGINGYSFVNDFEITVTDNVSEKIDLYNKFIPSNNIEIVNVPDTFVKDYKSKDYFKYIGNLLIGIGLLIIKKATNY